jgi:hypothetical protein
MNAAIQFAPDQAQPGLQNQIAGVGPGLAQMAG